MPGSYFDERGIYQRKRRNLDFPLAFRLWFGRISLRRNAALTIRYHVRLNAAWILAVEAQNAVPKEFCFIRLFSCRVHRRGYPGGAVFLYCRLSKREMNAGVWSRLPSSWRWVSAAGFRSRQAYRSGESGGGSSPGGHDGGKIPGPWGQHRPAE